MKTKLIKDCIDEYSHYDCLTGKKYFKQGLMKVWRNTWKLRELFGFFYLKKSTSEQEIRESGKHIQNLMFIQREREKN